MVFGLFGFYVGSFHVFIIKDVPSEGGDEEGESINIRPLIIERIQCPHIKTSSI